MRTVALSRKNYLWLGRNGPAIFYSLVATAKQQGVEPCEYLCDILSKIPIQLTEELVELLPAEWKERRNRGNQAS